MVSTTAAGLPGLRGTDHIGLTVPNLEEAVDFLVRVIGCESFYRDGPFQSDGNWMSDHLNVHPAAIIRKIRWLRCANGPNLELFQYEAPDQHLEPPRNSDVGGHHLAFYVDDFALALQHLVRHSVRVLGEPTVRTAGPNAGQTWVYFLAPWGLQLELVSYPGGKGYEKDYPTKLWHPAHPTAAEPTAAVEI